ncbi:MAG TPA: hypothetical protein VIV60_30895, partial [Polyangiaceae bacterium]
INPRLTVISAVFPETPPANVSYGADQVLDVRNNGHVLVTAGTLTLQAGHYTFESLTLSEGARLQLDSRTEPVYVDIKGGFSFSGETEAFNPSRLRFAVFGSAGATIAGDTATTPFRGTIVAMRGPIAYTSARPCHGALFGAQVSVQTNAEICRVPFAAWESQT